MKSLLFLFILLAGCSQEVLFVSQPVAEKAQEIIPPLEEAISYFKLANEQNREANLKVEESNSLTYRGNDSANTSESSQLRGNAERLYAEAEAIQMQAEHYDSKANCLMSLLWASLSSERLDSKEDRKCGEEQIWGRNDWTQRKQSIDWSVKKLEDLPEPFQRALNLIKQYYPINDKALQLITETNQQIEQDIQVPQGAYRNIYQLKTQAVEVLEEALKVLKSLRPEITI